MSGTVGIFRRDGATVERPLLYALTKFLSFRGPDAQEVWSDGAIGFGHTMLRTTREAAHERQPASLEGRFWITADVRLDCRSELIEALQQAGRRFDSAQITDPELILHAYAAWGEGCVDKLRGDFAFALWDARERRVFCARDHFGIKPFFYVAKENQFVFSNTLNCLRAHPDVSDELNDAAIGDFLLFGLNCDVATTTFQDIQRLPPAHFLVVSAEGLRTRKYWSPPIDGRIRYKRDEEYVEHFLEIFKAAVADRLRTDRVGIFLSGGLDSGSIAAMARELSESSRSVDLHGCTYFYEKLVRSGEKFYAGQTAEFLRIPVEYLRMDDFPLFYRWGDPEAAPPEPIEEPFWAAWYEPQKIVARQSRVALSGDGGDNLLHFQMWPYAKDLFRRGKWGTLSKDVAHYLWIRPFPWKGLRARLASLFGKNETDPVPPSWIRRDFVEGMSLGDRWRNSPLRTHSPHPLLPRGHASLGLPHWTYSFELADPGVNRHPVEVRYPYLDLRMIDYLLSIPTFPWAFRKKLMRDAMKDRLPEVTLRRAKTPLPQSPTYGALRQLESTSFQNMTIDKELERFIDPAKLPTGSRPKMDAEARLMIRPLCLNFWLQYRWRQDTVIVGGT